MDIHSLALAVICGALLASAGTTGGEPVCPTMLEEPTWAETAEGPSPLAWAEPSPEWVSALPQAEGAEQLFIVSVTGRSAGEASMHQRDEKGVWKELMTSAASIGRNGLGKTREGDGKTPAGVFCFESAFGIAPDPGCTIPYRQVTADDWWSGDQRPGYMYNRMVSLAALPDLDRSASEHIIENTYAYQYCLNISYNQEGIPGLGSAIFLHCPDRRAGPTAGCVAIPTDDMFFVMQNVQPGCVVIIDSRENLLAAGGSGP